MAMNTNIAPDIDTYIAAFPPVVQKQLNIMRSTIRKVAPTATEAIKYAIPTFVLNGNLVHFAAYTNHIGFYPAPVGIAAFEDELSVYKQGKGSVQFPIDEPLPIELITKIVEYRVQQQEVKVKKSPSARGAERG